MPSYLDICCHIYLGKQIELYTEREREKLEAAHPSSYNSLFQYITQFASQDNLDECISHHCLLDQIKILELLKSVGSEILH